MKTNKLIAAGAMALSMAMTPVASLINAMPIAADTLTIQNSQNEVTYSAYQIFSGTVTKIDDKEVLADITWGIGISDNGKQALITAAKVELPEGTLATSNEAAKLLSEKLGDITSNSTEAKNIAEIAAANTKGSPKTVTGNGDDVTIDDLDSGYYVIVDNATDAKASAAILKIAGDVTISPKTTNVPTTEKKVVEDDKTVTGVPAITPVGDGNTALKWNDVADYDIGQEIPFELSAKLPASLANYNNYSITFTDEMDAGFDLISTANTMEVWYKTTTGRATKLTENYTVTIDEKDINNFTVGVTVKTAGNSIIPDGATVTVRFKAKLNASANVGTTTGNVNSMKLTYPIKPGSSQTGTTEPDKVVVFTYGLDITKTDNKNQALTGAEFYLKNGEKFFKGTPDTDGVYTFVEWVDTEQEATKLAGKTVNGELTNQFELKGIDDGSYTLIETTVPDGYQTPNAFTVVITATTNHIQNWDGTTVTDANGGLSTTVNGATADADGTSITIENTPGGSLPETGGMGTTLIYGAGALMAAGAAVVYVTNKRTRKD